MKTVTLTDLLRESGEVIRAAETCDVLVKRRDGADLMLIEAKRADRMQEAADMFARAFLKVATMSGVTEDPVSSWIELVPWLRFLPESDRAEFVTELAQTAEACESLGNYDALIVVFTQWRNTAEAWASGAVRDALTSNHDDDVPVGRPNLVT